METVTAFNIELCSLYSTKPPISKTKMVELTKLAMKAAKFYKHVVQSIEKFINKCQPEFKIPGLYVIDSIVRQSRHQFGADKDVFSQRFSKNIAMTFHNLLACPAQDICKIIRVLNLWQKNSVFPPTIIQPLLDMAADPSNAAVYLTAQRSIQRSTGMVPSVPQSASGSASASRAAVRSSSGSVMDSDVGTSESQGDVLKAISQLLQQPAPVVPLLNPQQLQLHLIQQQLLQQLQVQQQPEPPLSIDGNLMAQIQALTAALMSRLGGGGSGGGGGGAGVGEESVASEELVSALETSPGITKKFMDVSYTESDLEDDRRDVHSCSSLSLVSALPMDHGPSQKHRSSISDMPLGAFGHSSKLWSPEEVDASRAFGHDVDQSHDEISDVATPRSCQPRPPTTGSEDGFLQSTPCVDELPLMQKVDRRSHLVRGQKADDMWDKCYGESNEWSSVSVKQPSEERLIRKSSAERHENPARECGHDEAVSKDQSSSRSDRKSRHFSESVEIKDSRISKASLKEKSLRDIAQSASTEAEKKLSRGISRSRSRSRNSHRSRSRSRSRTISSDKKHRSQSPDHNHSWRHLEHEKSVSRWHSSEFLRSHQVPLKEQHVSIISLTVRIGNVSRQVKDELLRAEVTRFGKASINLVPQRGCAFACFETRQEAERAIEGLNNMKLMDKTLKVAWAPNLGIKESEFKSRWDVDLGITYVPWDRLPPDLEAVAVGGVVDEKSLPEQMKISSKSAPVFRDDQMTSNEVTSSTDCQQDGQGPVTPSNTTTLPGNSLPSVAHLPLVPGTSASDISPGETAKEVATSLPLHAAETSAPAAAEKDVCSKISVEQKASQELSLIPEISLTRSQFVQGIQNILNSANASSVNSAQSVPGIIAPGSQTPTSAADVLFPPVPGIWPSLCGFNPHVPPPGFLPTFDPTRPPPSFGQTTPAGEPASLSEKKPEESNCKVIEDTSENMDLDDSGSSSQGDEQDFLESQIELVCADPASSGLRFAESESKGAKANSWSLDRDKSDYVGQNVVASADSSWNSTGISSTAAPSADLTSLSCAVSDDTMTSSVSNNCTVLGPPFKKALISLESSQNSSGLGEKPANISIIPGPVLDGSNNESLKSADGCFAPRNSELTIHSNLGPVSPFVDKPNKFLAMAPGIPFHGQGMVSHGPPNTLITLGDCDRVSLDKERHALEPSAGSFIGTTPHLQSEVKNEGRQIHELLSMPRGISAPHSEMKPPFDFRISGDPNRSLSEIAMSKSMPMGLPGKQNQISCGPGSYGIAAVPGTFGNRNVLDSHGQLAGRLVDALQQMPDGSQRSIRGLGASDGNPQMDARQNLPFRLPIGPDSLLRMRGGQMPIISDSNGQNCLPFGAEVGPSLGPEGPSQMSVGHVRMPFGPNGVQGSGQNQISDGPHTMQGSSFGCHGPNQMSVDGKERGFGGLLAVHTDPVRLPGMPFAPVQIPSGLDVMRGRPPHIDGPNLTPSMSGMQSRPQQISEQMPRIYDRGMDVAIGANRMPIPNQIPNTNQMPGSHGIAVSNQMTISNQLPGQVLMSGGGGGPLGASPDSSIEKYGLRPGQAPFLRMFAPGPGVGQPGHGGVEVGSTGSILGPGLQFPLGIARMLSSNAGGPASVQQCVLPFVPEIMPSLDGMTRDGRRDVSQNHERLGRFGTLPLGEGGLPSAPGIMPAGSGERFFGPAGMNRGPSAVPPPSVEGTLQNSCNAPMGFNRPAFIPSNVPDSPVIGLNRPPVGPLVMSSSSFGGRGTPSGPGPVFTKPMESAAQLNCSRDQPFGFNRSVEIGMKHAVSGPPSSDFPHGFSGNQPFVKSDVHPFANRTGSGDFDQNLVANQKLKCGILENAEKMQMGSQQCLPTSICGGIGFQGLLGLRNNSVDGKPLNKPVGLLGIDGKMNAMPNIFSSMDGINLVPGQQAFVGQDPFFLKPQIENLQQIESRGWHDDDDEDDGRTAGRHIRRSDLFPSLRQRGRHQHGGHRWHDRRHDHRDFKDRGGRNRDYFHRFGSRDNRAGGRSEPPANASGKDHQVFDNKTEVRFDAEIKSESKPGFNKSGFESDVKSEYKADTNLEIYDKKTVAEMEIQCTEVKTDAAADVPDSVVAANACDSS